MGLVYGCGVTWTSFQLYLVSSSSCYILLGWFPPALQLCWACDIACMCAAGNVVMFVVVLDVLYFEKQCLVLIGLLHLSSSIRFSRCFKCNEHKQQPEPARKWQWFNTLRLECDVVAISARTATGRVAAFAPHIMDGRGRRVQVARRRSRCPALGPAEEQGQHELRQAEPSPTILLR